MDAANIDRSTTGWELHCHLISKSNWTRLRLRFARMTFHKLCDTEGSTVNKKEREDRISL